MDALQTAIHNDEDDFSQRAADFPSYDPCTPNAVLAEGVLKLLISLLEREGLEPSTPAL